MKYIYFICQFQSGYVFDIEIFIFVCFSMFISITKGTTIRKSAFKTYSETQILDFAYYDMFTKITNNYLLNMAK